MYMNKIKTRKNEFGRFIGAGIAIGAGLGVAIQNIALGVGIGLLLSVIMMKAAATKNDR
ncbi:MAG: hypothetical protein INQ03_15910 [Candidatus Heimdallarchaeota archaeon]|nr:hypothetical protein [Candidatus Heimdallarchaeota archaeon]